MDFDKNICPVLNVDGVMATGKQFDLEINLPEDNRTVIYGIIKDCYKEPVCDAVVKLVEVVCEHGEEERRPVSHTFTDKNGEFVFGPLCANRLYEIEVWVDRVKHCKVCTSCKHEGKCLKGIELNCPPCHENLIIVIIIMTNLVINHVDKKDDLIFKVIFFHYSIPILFAIFLPFFIIFLLLSPIASEYIIATPAVTIPPINIPFTNFILSHPFILHF